MENVRGSTPSHTKPPGTKHQPPTTTMHAAERTSERPPETGRIVTGWVRAAHHPVGGALLPAVAISLWRRSLSSSPRDTSSCTGPVNATRSYVHSLGLKRRPCMPPAVDYDPEYPDRGHLPERARCCPQRRSVRSSKWVTRGDTRSHRCVGSRRSRYRSRA
jgi:hypothetical protein